MAQPVPKEAPQHQIIRTDQSAEQTRAAIAEHTREAVQNPNVDVTPETEKDLKLRQNKANAENAILLDKIEEEVWDIENDEEKDSTIGEAGVKLLDVPDEIPPEMEDRPTPIEVLKDFVQQITRSLKRRPGPYFLDSAKLKEMKEENAQLRGQKIIGENPKHSGNPSLDHTKLKELKAEVAPKVHESQPQVSAVHSEATTQPLQAETPAQPTTVAPQTEVPQAVQQTFENSPAPPNATAQAQTVPV